MTTTMTTIEALSILRLKAEDIKGNPETVTANIKKAYRKAALVEHPDSHPQDQKETQTKRFQKLQEAADFLLSTINKKDHWAPWEDKSRKWGSRTNEAPPREEQFWKDRDAQARKRSEESERIRIEAKRIADAVFLDAKKSLKWHDVNASPDSLEQLEYDIRVVVEKILRKE